MPIAARAVLAATCLALAACADRGVVDPHDLRPATRPATTQAAAFPDVIPLPTGYAPEGIAAGTGTAFYVSSIPTGAIVRLDARTGEVAPLVPAQPGLRQASGLKHDPRGGRLFVAGGMTGQAYVYDAATGATLAVYQLTNAPGTLVNDVVVLEDAAYFTDSFRPVLYRVPLGKAGALPPAGAVQEIPLGGDYAFVPGQFNGNGIDATPNEKTLVVVNSTTGKLYRVDPATGVADEIALAGAAVPAGDGILLDGRDLYVVQGFLNQIAVVRLSPDLASGTIARVITSPAFRIPSTIAEHGSALYAVNARFDVAPPPLPADGVAFEVVRVAKH